MAILNHYADNSPEGVGNIGATIDISVATVLSLTASAGNSPVSHCRGVYLSTGGTLTCKLTHDTTAKDRVLGAGYHPLKITEITNIGSCVGFIYW